MARDLASMEGSEDHDPRQHVRLVIEATRGIAGELEGEAR